jgi:CheY-like chemotaxis protein
MLSGAAQPALLQSEATQPAWRALVADDNATNQLILGEMLELLGLSVQIASTGQQAVAHWQERAIDVLLIDYQMPGMDGLSAVAQIRAQELEEGLPRLPIVLVSGDATLRSLEEWRQHGIDHVLSKPIEFADLSRLIELMQQARQ